MEKGVLWAVLEFLWRFWEVFKSVFLGFALACAALLLPLLGIVGCEMCEIENCFGIFFDLRIFDMGMIIDLFLTDGA